MPSGPRAHHVNVAGGVLHDPRSRRSEQALKGSVPMRAHDEELRVRFSCELTNATDRRRQDRMGLRVGRCMNQENAQVPCCIAQNVVAHLSRRLLRERFVRLTFDAHGANHVGFRPKGLREFKPSLEDARGARRTVESNDNRAFEGVHGDARSIVRLGSDHKGRTSVSWIDAAVAALVRPLRRVRRSNHTREPLTRRGPFGPCATVGVAMKSGSAP